MYDDNDEATKFDPSPLGSRQRVLPRRTFKAVASVIAQVPVAQSLVARVADAGLAGTPTFGTPFVSEADIPTWRVPKLELYPTKPRSQLDLRLWLPVIGLLSMVVIALLGAYFAGGGQADATTISAALHGETSDNRFYSVANIEEPPTPAIVEAAPPPKAKHASVRASRAAKRPLLAVDVSTPLGDLATKRRR